MRRHLPLTILGPALAVYATTHAHAETYLTEDQAGSVMFPGETLTDASLTLTDAQQKQIAKESGVRVRDEHVKAFKASGGGWLFFDSVVGKHELIDFAVALNPDGAVKGVEILEYRETYGQQVHDPAWRHQFIGRTVASPLKLDEDIRNITGATLSSNNVTRGVRRLLKTWDVALRGP